jgi:hypothetical protein
MTEPLSADESLALPGERFNFRYTEDQWQAIAKTLPVTCDQARVRKELEITVSEFQRFSELEKTKYWSTSAQKAKAWKRAERAAVELLNSIKAAEDDPDYLQFVGDERDWRRRYRKDLTPAEFAAARKFDHEQQLGLLKLMEWRFAELAQGFSFVTKSRQGRKNPPRAFLYHHVVRIWTHVVCERIKWSRSPTGEPTGPLVEFFIACVAPVLGNTAPGREGIKDILEREKKS